MAVAKHSNGRFLRKRLCPVNAVSSPLRRTAAFSVLQNSVKGSGEIFLCVTLLVHFFFFWYVETLLVSDVTRFHIQCFAWLCRDRRRCILSPWLDGVDSTVLPLPSGRKDAVGKWCSWGLCYLVQPGGQKLYWDILMEIPEGTLQPVRKEYWNPSSFSGRTWSAWDSSENPVLLNRASAC